MSGQAVWGPATPAWLRKLLGPQPELRKAVQECLTEQAHPSNMDMFPAANAVIERLSWEELEALVDQGGL